MTKESGNHQYVSYPMFKGLQKPLEFMGFQGRYITWAAATVGGGILSFIIVYCILGFIAMIAFSLGHRDSLNVIVMEIPPIEYGLG